ncbi:MAG: DUF58 domain-containing protein [Sedimentibacter saalensis]|uniref:DUF58 domain-containing protein n=1 Tax=Sedimentibacter saalensis TaxID=130788 RepID=UPI002B1F55A1|nr:DUF58 domain-containing protein [Sedimentibacter saalensis]MEA5093986.1 DUF58 domain-containing protein [Sedimentibacter saalensis]
MISKRLEYLVLLLAAFFFHIFVVDYISFWILAFLLMLPLVSLLITVLAMGGATAELIINKVSIQKNESLPIQLKIHNKHLFLTCMCMVKLTIQNELLQQEETRSFFMTATHSGHTVEQVISSKYCGMIKCSISELKIYDALGLFSFRKETESSYFVSILPSVYPLMAMSSKIQQDIKNNIISRTVKGNDPSEFMDVREYRDGDRLARIHWKLSDKYDQIMVKDFGDPISNDVLLLFDLNGNSDEKICGLLDAVYSISNFLIKNQITYEIQWYDSVHERAVLTEIAQNNDLVSAFEAIMAKSRYQKQSWILKNCNNACDYKPYSVVLYLCSEITSNSIALIHKRLAGSRINILLVTDVPGTRTDLTVLDLKNIKENMSNLVI